MKDQNEKHILAQDSGNYYRKREVYTDIMLYIKKKNALKQLGKNGKENKNEK